MMGGGWWGYVVGSEEGRNASDGDLRECQEQLKLLAQALGTVLVSSKTIVDRPMTGPELLAHAGSLALALDTGELKLVRADALVIERDDTVDEWRHRWPVWACEILDHDVAALAEAGSEEILDALLVGASQVGEPG